MNSARRFQRRVEDFVCEHCGVTVTGNGYTNHCPECLWSKHVDINPGDRAEQCQGLMQPVRVLGTSSYRIEHRCMSCGELRRVKTSEQDDFDTLVEIARGGR